MSNRNQHAVRLGGPSESNDRARSPQEAQAKLKDATHKQLLGAVRPDERYEQMRRGELDDEMAWPLQCFACAFYHPLRGERGMDWGVCFNQLSPRAGLLNFEHYGCAEWEPSEQR